MPPLDSSAFDAAFYEFSTPDELARQPLELKDAPKPGKNWPEIYPQVEARRRSLINWRYSWWAYWSEIARFTLPERYHWFITANTWDRGRPVNDAIIDTTIVTAVRTCASGMWTGLTSPSRPWFDLTVALPWITLDGPAIHWLYDTKLRINTVLAQSNFYNTMAQAFKDVAVFGTAPVVIYEHAEKVIQCFLPCAGEYCLALGGDLGVDAMYWEFNLTVLGIVDRFGLENCPSIIRDAWRQGTGSLDKEFTICCAIEPNIVMKGQNDQSFRVVPEDFAYREIYWLRGSQSERELSRRGFNERPFFAARWSTTSNDPYGRSPGMEMLGDNKQLQSQTRKYNEYLEKGVRPPMVADVFLKNQPSSTRPGDITYGPTENGRKPMYPAYEVSAQWGAPMIETMGQVQKRINKGFYVEVFMAITQMEGIQPRNELELTKRDLERLQELGPVIDLFETEFASPAIMRVMGIMQRKGMLLPLPPSLQGMPLKLNYRSIMKIAQEAAETASMERTFAVLGNLSAAAKAAGVPDPIRRFNLDYASTHYAGLQGYPADGIYSDEEVKQMDLVKAKQAEQAQMLQATLPAVQAAHTLSQTQVGGGQSALQMMMGGGGPGGPG